MLTLFYGQWSTNKPRFKVQHHEVYNSVIITIHGLDIDWFWLVYFSDHCTLVIHMTRSHDDDKTSWLMMMTKPGQVVPRTRHWRNLKIHVSPVTIVLEHVTVRTHVTYDTACVHYLSLITYNTKHFFSIQSKPRPVHATISFSLCQISKLLTSLLSPLTTFTNS